MNNKKILIETSATLNKEKLREIAIKLEEQLKKDAPKSKDILALSEYAPLVSAIQRAKQGLINKPEEIQNTQYWIFETELNNYSYLSSLFADFLVKLKGWHIREIPDNNQND